MTDAYLIHAKISVGEVDAMKDHIRELEVERDTLKERTRPPDNPQLQEAFRILEAGATEEQKAALFVLSAAHTAQSAAIMSRAEKIAALTVERDVLKAAAEWNFDMDSAPKNATDFEVAVTRAGCRGVLIVHWAHGGDEDQPRFGPGLFYWTGHNFLESTEKPKAWRHLPTPPKDRI